MSTTGQEPRATEAPVARRVGQRDGASGLTGWAANFLDERTGVSVLVRQFGRKIFPDHWSFMLGEVALYSFIVLLLTGAWLTFFFQASGTGVIYHGSYVPLKGLRMSAALESTLNISFDIRGGLLIRQVHHWAALLFNAAIGLHMLRHFFTGSFRKPRELNWLIGFTLYLLAMLEGFTGYSLPDDLLSGNGLRILSGGLLGLPVIGSWANWLVFGGEFPGTQLVGRLYSLHILLVPAAILGLIALHLTFVVVHKHTQFPGAGRTNENVIGYPILPAYAAKAGGFFFLVAGTIVMLGTSLTINPIWTYGPYDPSPVSAGTQPDWYIGFADGALRLVPHGWEITLLNTTYSLNILVPAAALGVFLGAVAFYPFLESWVTGDTREHHLLDRPRNRPTRTGIGAAGVTFYAVLWAAAGADLVATQFRVSIEGVITTLQVLTLLAPAIAYLVTKRLCIALQRRDREIVLHGYESGRIVRLPGGEYAEVHRPIDEYERWRLVDYTDYQPLMLRPDESGRITVRQRARAALSRWFFEDRIEPITETDLALEADGRH